MLVCQAHDVIIPRLVQILLLLLGMVVLGLASGIVVPSLLLYKQLLVLVLVMVITLMPVQTRCWKEIVLLGLMLLLMLAYYEFRVWRLEVLVPMVVVAGACVLVLLESLMRVVKFWYARNQGRGGRLVKWGPHEWVLDSGAWNHHTPNLELLLQGGNFQFQAMDNEGAPSSGEDVQHVRVLGRGSVRMDSFDFPGIDYVGAEDTIRNVVSVSQLARDHGRVTVFEPTSCHVKDKKTGQIVGKGRLRNGMYMLDFLRIVGQYIGDKGASGGDHHDGTDGGGGGRGHEARGNGEVDSTDKARGGDGRDGRGGGTGARNVEESSGSGATIRDVNEMSEECGDEKEIEEMNENDEDEVKEIGEMNRKGDKEEDDKTGGQNSRQLSSRPYTGLFGLSRFACILWIVCILCVAACISIQYRILGSGVAILAFQLLKTSTMRSTICKLKQIGGSLFRGTSGDREISHQEHNKRLFGLSRFDETTDPTGYRCWYLPPTAFPMSTTNAAGRPEDFLVDSGASFHMTWKESILFHYPRYLQNHTKPPTRSIGGIATGSIAVKRSGYLNGNNIMLDAVLLAPEAQANLVSVGQLSRYYGVQVEMDDVGVVIKRKQDGVQIGGGRIVNSNHYVLEYFLPGGLFAHCCFTPQP